MPCAGSVFPCPKNAWVGRRGAVMVAAALAAALLLWGALALWWVSWQHAPHRDRWNVQV